MRYAIRSDPGLRREGNEDSAYAGPRLLAVADGIGGHAAGEVASALTIASMAELDAGQPGGDMLKALAMAVVTANARLHEKIIANPAVEGMGTTLTALLWDDGRAAICHIGQTRGYLVRDGELYQITHDHTLVQSLVDEGRISADDASAHPQRSVLLRLLDGRSIAEPDLSVHESLPGDRYLLCSDGLSGVVSTETLRYTLADIEDPEAATRQLIGLANRGGGPDNITCIVADVVDTATTRLPPTTMPVLAGAAAALGDLRLAEANAKALVRSASPVHSAECPVCSVDPASPHSTISAEGYCQSCGRKVPSGRDHSELDLGLLAGVTDRGLRHDRNEDAMALAAADGPRGPVSIAVVCDGGSTSPRPDDASLAAAQAAVRTLLASARRGDDPAGASLAAVYAAHQALARLGSPGEAPSATYISAVIDNDAVTVCWLGNSRAYWLSTGPDATRLSTDDSLAEEMTARGAMSEAEVLTSPQAHVITRRLGADLAEPSPHAIRFEPPGPGVVLVCSDGLWNYRPDTAGLAQLALPAALTDPLGAAAELVKFALDSGGTDNITVVLAPFPPTPFPPSEPAT